MNEAHLYDIKKEDVITKKYLDIIANDDEIVIETYRIENNLSDEYFYDDPDYKEWVEEKIDIEYNKKINELQDLISLEDGTIEIWRAMKVEDDWIEHLLKNGKHLGIYWSYEESGAEPHWGYNNDKRKNDIVLVTKVKEEYVDWINTIRLNVAPLSSEEKEIRLFKNTPIKIEELYFNGVLIKNNLIYKKIFYS